jgi:tetratricopeptide (TPR) repeat protein
MNAFLGREQHDPAVLSDRAEVLWLMDRDREALQDLNAALAGASGDALLWLKRSKVYLGIKRYREALQDVNCALEIRSHSARALVQRGEIYRAMHDNEKAILEYDLALSIDNLYAPAFKGRGRTYRALGRYDHALTDLRQAIHLDSRDAYGFREMAEIYHLQGKLSDAFEQLDAALRVAARPAWILCCRASIQRDLGAYDEALRDFNSALQLEPGMTNALNGRGWTYLITKNPDAALADFGLALSTSNDSWFGYSQFVAKKMNNRMLEANQEFTATIREVDRQFLETPEDRLNAFNRGLYYSAIGNESIAYGAYLDALGISDVGLIYGARKELLQLNALFPELGANTLALKLLDEALTRKQHESRDASG